MAETRAINRALRLYNNIGMCSAEELGGEAETKTYPKTYAKQNLYLKIKKESQNNEPDEETIIDVISRKTGVNIQSLNELTEDKCKELITLWA
jgi:hypothetical protein